MLMMHVGHMRMRVHQSCMPMLMRVGFAQCILWPVRMLMMFIMRVGVRMSYRFMLVEVFVALRDMKPHAETHQCTGNNEWKGNGLAKCKNCRRCAEKGGG